MLQLLTNTNDMNYQDVINLGFKEKVCEDNVYYSRHGYPYAIISLKLIKGLKLYWEKSTKEFELIRYDKKGNVLFRKDLTDNEVSVLMDIFNINKEESISSNF